MHGVMGTFHHVAAIRRTRKRVKISEKQRATDKKLREELRNLILGSSIACSKRQSSPSSRSSGPAIHMHEIEQWPNCVVGPLAPAIRHSSQQVK